MKHILLLSIAFTMAISSRAQITITASDMPVSGDTLRYSIASPIGSGISLGDSGASFSWDYSSLTPIAQNVDSYRTALSVSPLYLLISFSAYGYKIADSFPGLSSVLPVSITQLYTFFEKKTSPNSFAAVAFGARIAGIPTPSNYTTDDTWYFFPLNYADNDSANFKLTISLASVGSLKQVGYRKSRVDGWGTIKTPLYTTPVSCLRIRSEINEIDSIGFGASASFGIPRKTVEYKWLANGEHYPALWVTTNVIGSTETISSVRYRDIARTISTGITPATSPKANIVAVPNPVINGTSQLSIPASWTNYSVEVFDIAGKLVVHQQNNNVLNMSTLPSGTYVARISNGIELSYVQIVK